jgi:hypothetical protein
MDKAYFIEGVYSHLINISIYLESISFDSDSSRSDIDYTMTILFLEKECVQLETEMGDATLFVNKKVYPLRFTGISDDFRFPGKLSKDESEMEQYTELLKADVLMVLTELSKDQSLLYGEGNMLLPNSNGSLSIRAFNEILAIFKEWP